MNYLVDTSSSYSKQSARSFDSYDNKKYDTHKYRIDFIKTLLNGKVNTFLNLDSSDDKDYINNEKDARSALNRKTYNFYKVMEKIGATIIYVTSGASGHTFKGTVVENNGMKFDFGIKVVAYPKCKKKLKTGQVIKLYGGINDIGRPTNAELKMIKLLSHFVVNKETQHIVLPISIFNTNMKPFIDYMNTGFDDVNNKEKLYELYRKAIEKNKSLNIGQKEKKYCKYRDFIEKYNAGLFYNEVSILLSEWANKGDFLNFIRENYKEIDNKRWKVFFFQILSVLTIIQDKYPGFRHNDLKANNILVHKRKRRNTKFLYTICGDDYAVPDVGYILKLWDFDFACIPGIVDNQKVSAKWTSKLNIEPEQNRYYDMHYFFNTLTKFIKNFYDKVPSETIAFIERVIPKHLTEGSAVENDSSRCKKNRILIKDEYLTPRDVLKNDQYFQEFRYQR